MSMLLCLDVIGGRIGPSCEEKPGVHHQILLKDEGEVL